MEYMVILEPNILQPCECCPCRVTADDWFYSQRINGSAKWTACGYYTLRHWVWCTNGTMTAYISSEAVSVLHQSAATQHGRPSLNRRRSPLRMRSCSCTYLS